MRFPNNLFDWIVFVLSGEFFLWKRANSGGVIARRTLFTTIVIFAIALVLLERLQPGAQWVFNWSAAKKAISGNLPWLGAIFGAVYATYYTKYSSQWLYLAGVFNQIKNAEATAGTQEDVIAQWKGGFIADAWTLHLLRKELFATAISVWIREDKVRASLEAAGNPVKKWETAADEVSGHKGPVAAGSEDKRRLSEFVTWAKEPTTAATLALKPETVADLETVARGLA